MLLVVRLDDDGADAARDFHAMQIAGEGLFAGMVMPQLALAEHRAILASNAKAIRVALRRVVGRGNRDVEIERRRRAVEPLRLSHPDISAVKCRLRLQWSP